MDESKISEVIDNITLKIIERRKEKGFSIENMANELGLSNSAYNKIEKGDTKLTVERLLQLHTILDISLGDLFDINTENIYHQNLNDHAVGHQQIQNMYQNNMDLTDKFISSLKEEIEFLRGQLAKK
jgi:transcriptional regulator with XRE-family HTH domain